MTKRAFLSRRSPRSEHTFILAVVCILDRKREPDLSIECLLFGECSSYPQLTMRYVRYEL